MKTNFLNRMYDIANDALDYIQKQEGKIIFPEGKRPFVSVLLKNSYLDSIIAADICVESYEDGIIYPTNAKEYEEYDISDLDIYSCARLADAISEFKEE